MKQKNLQPKWEVENQEEKTNKKCAKKELKKTEELKMVAQWRIEKRNKKTFNRR